MKAFILFITLIAAASASSYSLYYGSYIELNDTNFDQATLDFELLLVKFYHPGCYWCDLFAPKYLEIGKQVRAEKIGVMPAEINIMENPLTKKAQNITRHPTVKLWVRAKKQWYNYSGLLNKDPIVQWVNTTLAGLQA